MLPPGLLPRPDFIQPFRDFDGFRGNRIGVTGHRGVLGSILCRRFDAAGISPIAYGHDIVDLGKVQQWIDREKLDLLFHFAALVPVKLVEENPLRAFETNAVGTYNLCKSIITASPRTWLFLASTSHVYQTRPADRAGKMSVDDPLAPTTFYGESKLAGERLARPLLDKYGVHHCIGRIFSFTHASQTEPYLVPSLTRRIQEAPPGSTLQLDDPGSVRDLLDAEVVIDGVLHLAQRRHRGVINIGSGEGTSVLALATRIASLLQKSVSFEGRHRNPPNTLVADIAPLKALLSIPT